jgi:phage tail sheath protein FI
MIHHGIKVIELTTGTRPIKAASTAIIGIVATATAPVGEAATQLNADFPVGEPVLVTDVNAAILRAGTGGTLAPTLAAIGDQSRPIVVVVRVTEPPAAEEPGDPTIDDAVKAGFDVLLQAESLIGIKPRILGAPALDTAPVTAKMVIVAKKLRAMVYARAIGEDITDAIDYAEDFAARELMLLWPNTNAAFAGDLTARALGLRAYIDQTQGWHKTLSNVPLDGVLGAEVPVFFDLNGVDTETALLNDKNITTLIRNNGWRLWGNRTCSAEPLYAFESATRSAQIIQDEIADGLAWAIDKPITKTLYRDILETIQARLRTLVTAQMLVGANAWIDPEKNPPAELAAGKIVVDYDFTPCAPAESITLNQQITDRYYGDIAQAL